NEDVLLYHAEAFADPEAADRIRRTCDRLGFEPRLIRVPAGRVDLGKAVASYLFNSQLLTIPDGGMLLLCPAECERDTDIRSAIDEILAGDHPIRAVEFVDVRESMRNGGGPACLRLRVVV